MTSATDRQDTGAQHFGRPVEQPRKTGRPSGFSQEIADRICSHIAEGGYATNLKRFGLPHEATVCRWLNEKPEFREAYARAKEQRAETFAAEIVEIADTCEDPAKARLQIDARKWVASKLLPRVYGENQRVEVQHTLSETAARVLAELSARQKREKAEQAKYIDVTPSRVLDADRTCQQDQPLAIEATASRTVEGQSADPGSSPPPPATTGGGGCSGTPPLSADTPRSARKPRKK